MYLTCKNKIIVCMKKSLLLIITLTFSLALAAQWYGNGLSPATAYYGEINSANPMQDWNLTNYPDSIIYIGLNTSGQNDLTVGNGGILTVGEGITIKFCSTLSDLRITGTGILNVSGSASYPVTFTKDSQSNWGHISFQNMTTTNPQNYPSIISNCIIEWGDVSSTALSPANPNQYGGAMYVDFSYVTITDCELRNNKAGWGGSIFVGDGKFPAISNCYIHGNTATTSGGGIYSWKNSSTIISNCIIINNNCSGTGGGGGIFIGGAAKGVKVINCVISSNTANNTTLGHNIKIFSNTASPKPQFINSIIWKPANSIVGSNYDADFYYCAIQDPPRATYTGCIPLNSENAGMNPAGPFFASMTGNQWTLQIISPLLDAGTIPAPAVPTDYTGNPRIYNYDIGTYEYQYSRWKTTASTTDWNTGDNWYGGIPVSNRDVIIPAGASLYPTATPGPDLTIGAGKQMIIEPGARVTINSLTNNGIIKLNHNATDFASLILDSYTRGIGGSEEIELYLEGGGSALNEDYKWHYISTPVSSLLTDVFTVNTYNLAQFVETRPSASLLQGWVAYDGYVYSTGNYDGPTFSSLIPGKGYNYFNDVSITYSFGGMFNTSDLPAALSFTTGTPLSMHGFNLLGNPFSSGLNWDDIIDGLFFPYPANTSKGLYFSRNNEQCSYIAGVGVPADVTGIIPPMQGFFIKTYSTENFITLPKAARTHNNIHSRYKGGTDIPLVRLAVFEKGVSNDETVVRFNDLAKSDLDNDYDAIKMFLSSNKTSIYTSLEGTNYSINGLPFPESTLEIPVVVNLISAGTHKISATQLQGLDNYNVFLTDKTTGFTANLKNTPDLTFSASAGSIRNRFSLKISNVSTGTEDIHSSENSFNVYQNYDKINIQTLADAWDGKTGSVRVLDMAGKVVKDLNATEFSKTSVTQVQAPALNGLYFLEIRSGVMKYVGKVLIK